MLQVAAAIIFNKNKILIAKRREQERLGGKWEFPGGKIERGEDAIECLQRELKEEFDVSIEVGDFFDEVTYEYDFATIHLVFYFARIAHGKINSRDHQDHRWVLKEELLDFDFAPADARIIQKLSVL